MTEPDARAKAASRVALESTVGCFIARIIISEARALGAVPTASTGESATFLTVRLLNRLALQCQGAVHGWAISLRMVGCSGTK